MHNPQWSPQIILITICPINESKVNPAAIVPTFPISSAILSNFYYKGVGGVSSYKSALALPNYEFSPTAHINNLPEPSITLDPDTTKQL